MMKCPGKIHRYETGVHYPTEEEMQSWILQGVFPYINSVSFRTCNGNKECQNKEEKETCLV